MNELMSNEGVCRTAPATPGLLISFYASPKIGLPIYDWPLLLNCSKSVMNGGEELSGEEQNL